LVINLKRIPARTLQGVRHCDTENR
jgi:hypothetical protein